MSNDDLTADVREALDPTPASEVEWPVSRRDTLRALAGVGALAVGPGGAQGAAGTGIADEAYFSNYGWAPDADGGVLTIDGAEFTFDGSETVVLDDGREALTVVLDDGATASTVVGPDGSVLWEAPVPDSVVDNYEIDPNGVYAVSDTVADYYSGDTAEYSITDTSPLEGSRSLETSAAAESDLVSYPGDGLNNYASQGDVILVRYWAEDFAASDPPIDGLLFGVDSTVNEFYFLQFDGNNGRLNLRKFPGDTSVGETAVSWQSQETYTVKVDWNNDVATDITVELYDSTDSLVADFTGTESEYSHQGIGFRSVVFGVAEQTRRYDLLEAGDLSYGVAADGGGDVTTSGNTIQ